MRSCHDTALLCALALPLVAGACSRTRGKDDALLQAEGDAAVALCAQGCDDGLFCNGIEGCDPDTLTCRPAERAGCDDGDECTVDRCDEASDGCEHVATPRDDDRDGFDACEGDCDDDDPNIHPGARELCDDVDQDCDGVRDEGLLSECGDCRPGCRILRLPEPSGWNPTEENSSAVLVQDDALVLSFETSQRFDAWIANYFEGQVTKLDTRDGVQLARYDSVLRDGTNGAAPPDVECDRQWGEPILGGNCPSRTAVDFNGAVYVANRAFGRQGTVTKIAGFEEDCVDRDGDGAIETSRDLDGNGRIDLHVPGEYLGQDDECLLWTVDVGGIDGVPRAVAVAPDGGVWVGLNEEQRVIELDPRDGSVRHTINIQGFKPYGGAIDARGRLWLTEGLTGRILPVDTEHGRAGDSILAPELETGCPSSYGIAVDTEDRIWIAGFTCPYVFRYTPETKSWASFPVPDSGVTRGIAADDRGRIFVASSHEWIRIDVDSSTRPLDASDPITRLTVLDAEDGGHLRVFGGRADPLPGAGSIGVGLDADGRAWLVNQDTGSATRVDVDTGEVSHFGVGGLPYTYSDFTGFALRRITAPTGHIRGVLEGCEMGPSEWEILRHDAEIPSGGRIEIRLRAAASREALARTPWLGPWRREPIDLLAAPGPLPEERFLEVEARLIAADRSHSPRLHEITVQVHCPL